jgi:hypothetical protein
MKTLIKKYRRHLLYTLLALCVFAVFYIVMPFIPMYNGYEWVKRPDWFFVESMIRIGTVVVASTHVTFLLRQKY